MKRTKNEKIYNGLEQFVHYWVMPLWLVSTCRWQTRMTSVNWAVFAAPCLLRSEMKEHFIGWCCQPSKYSTFRFFFFPSFLSQKTHSLINYCESKYLSSLAYKRSCRNVVTLQHLLKTSLQLFHKPFSYMQWFFCILYCNFSLPQSLCIFTYIYSNQICLRFLHVLQFL